MTLGRLTLSYLGSLDPGDSSRAYVQGGWNKFLPVDQD